jgi:hypothetical protein
VCRTSTHGAIAMRTRSPRSGDRSSMFMCERGPGLHVFSYVPGVERAAHPQRGRRAFPEVRPQFVESEEHACVREPVMDIKRHQLAAQADCRTHTATVPPSPVSRGARYRYRFGL